MISLSKENYLKELKKSLQHVEKVYDSLIHLVEKEDSKIIKDQLASLEENMLQIKVDISRIEYTLQILNSKRGL